MAAPLRPLLPTTARRPPVEPPRPRKRDKVSVACEACRLHKTKCTAERPSCQACTVRQIPCRYIQREFHGVKQKYEEHKEFVNLVRTLPEQDAIELFHRVRAGGDVAAIVSHARDGNLLLQLHLAPETRFRYELPYSRDMPTLLLTSGSPYLDSLVYEAAAQRALLLQAQDPATTEPEHRVFPPEYTSSEYRSEYVRPYHAAVLIEPRIENVKPSEWTTVSKDDALMRDLLTAYFAHEYHLWPVFHKDYFLEDMAKPKSENRKTPCCSALLVNAILAYACYSSKKIENRFRYWEPDGLGYRFLAEAKRIWEMQTINRKNRNLASVQAALVINIIYNIYGLDKLGTPFGLQGLAIALDLRLFDGNADVKSERVRNARNFTAWCLFNIDRYEFLRPPFLTKPPSYELPDPSTNAVWYSEIWTRYPLSPTLSPTYYGHIFKATSEFRVILSELCHASFSTASKLPTDKAMLFVSRLLTWYKNLPTVLLPKYIVLPAHFLIHLDYQITLMIVCQPYSNDKWENGLVPKDIIANAERDINVLIRLYYFRHGFEDAHLYLTSPLSKLGFMSLNSIHERMTHQELDYARSSLLLALKGLREQGRNYYIVRTIYHIIKNQLRPEESRLLQGLEDRETEYDKDPGLVGEIQSAWTPTVFDISEDPSATELSKLAKRYLKLESEEPSDSEAGNCSPLSV
ncbi:uncharacterized protein SETTUDRAFT_103856 [Exserohilum turcica Et28A]|uniref:Zn(2)-C6 fungal-type domain-containing protein n=1 Tax=Exserohilum turcicum (strain 28A) TaxID=671987 RepID=R0IY25_EXST2|nr:uncharacterized protein SETTUDRAFT_103856 [Exserohilum turcica Et28A]EOA89630.1 hypothetical protein SETTUDRAFT_103856 [Exserohilum turcica Et28A]